MISRCYKANDYFILHHGDSISHIEITNLDPVSGVISFRILDLPKEHTGFTKKMKPKHRYDKRYYKNTTSEIHLFTSEVMQNDNNGSASVTLAKINKAIELNDDLNRKRASYLTPIIVLGVIAGFIAIAAMSLSIDSGL